MNTDLAGFGLRELLRGVRVVAPAHAPELPRAAATAAALRQQLAAVRAQRLALLDAAVTAARAEGYRAGYALALRELQAVRARLDAWSADGDGALQALLLDALRRLLGAVPPDVTAALLAQRALRAAGANAGTLRVCVHPAQRDNVAARLAAAGLAHDVDADAACAPGACRIETQFGALHADLETQLAALGAALERGHG